MKKTTKSKSESTTPAKKPVQTSRHLRHEFDQDEKIENAKQLAEALSESDRIDADLERVKADFKARTSTVEAKIGALRDKVTSGYEMRETKCEWRFDNPKRGKKTLYRLDTKEAVETVDMSEADKQGELPPPAEKPTQTPAPEAFGTNVGTEVEKATAKTNHRGVVSVPADGDDVRDSDDNKTGN